jgi:ribosome biogenesis protein Tsr3
MNDSRIVTEPDLNLDHRFKILLVDVDWTDVERLSSTIEEVQLSKLPCSFMVAKITTIHGV